CVTSSRSSTNATEMTLERLRMFCSTLPHVTEDVKWGDHLCFLIAEKMFCITTLNPHEGNRVSFKCTPEDFAELIERDGIIRAPYMARNHWVSLEKGTPCATTRSKPRLRSPTHWSKPGCQRNCKTYWCDSARRSSPRVRRTANLVARGRFLLV